MDMTPIAFRHRFKAKPNLENNAALSMHNILSKMANDKVLSYSGLISTGLIVLGLIMPDISGYYLKMIWLSLSLSFIYFTFALLVKLFIFISLDLKGTGKLNLEAAQVLSVIAFLFFALYSIPLLFFQPHEAIMGMLSDALDVPFFVSLIISMLPVLGCLAFATAIYFLVIRSTFWLKNYQALIASSITSVAFMCISVIFLITFQNSPFWINYSVHILSSVTSSNTYNKISNTYDSQNLWMNAKSDGDYIVYRPSLSKAVYIESDAIESLRVLRAQLLFDKTAYQAFALCHESSTSIHHLSEPNNEVITNLILDEIFASFSTSHIKVITIFDLFSLRLINAYDPHQTPQELLGV